MPKPPKLFWEKEEILLLKVRNRSNRVFLFEESFFRQNVSMESWSTLLTSSTKIYRQKTEIVSVIIRKPKDLGFSRKSCFCSLASHGHEELSLDNAPKNINKRPKTFHSLSKNDQNTVFLRKKHFLSRCFYEHLECSVGKPIGRSLTKRKTIFPEFMETIRKPNYFFWKKTFLSKKFVWTLRIQFLPPRRMFFGRKPTYFRLKTDNNKKHCFSDFSPENVSLDN